MLSCFSHVQLLATLWTVACQAPLSMGRRLVTVTILFLKVINNSGARLLFSAWLFLMFLMTYHSYLCDSFETNQGRVICSYLLVLAHWLKIISIWFSTNILTISQTEETGWYAASHVWTLDGYGTLLYLLALPFQHL